MHEYAITQNIVQIILEEARKSGTSKVLEVRLVIGDLSTVVDDSVSFYFKYFTKGTIAEDAGLVFRRVRAEFFCKQCQKNFEKPKNDFLCPECKTQGSLTDVGREFYIESIEVED